MLQIVALVLLSVWAFIQNLVYMSYLPERVAIHFGANGVADNWLDRGQATGMMIALQVLMPWVLVAIATGVKHMPSSMVNIPHREYWLHPERRRATLAYVVGMISFIAVLESILISVMNHLSFTANRTGQPLNTPVFIAVLGVFLVAVLALVVKMTRRFAMPTTSQPQAG